MPVPASSLGTVAAPSNITDGQQRSRAPLHHQMSPADYWGLQEPNHSYVSSCAVDSAQAGSCNPMDWTSALPVPAADAHASAASLAWPSATMAFQKPAVTSDAVGTEDPLASAAAAATAVANPWAWLSDATAEGVASGGASMVADPGDKAAAGADGAMGVAAHHHTASRRLFAPTEAEDPRSRMQWRLQQQAQQLQAELALATQQLQLHSIQFGTGPAVTLAG